MTLTTRRPSTRALVAIGVLVALLLAGVASFHASGDPDGLERVALDRGFADSAEDRAEDDVPLAGYETDGIADERLSVGVAGVLGSLVVLASAGGLVLAVRRRRPADDGA